MAVTFSPQPASLAWSHFRTTSRGQNDAHLQPTYDINVPSQGGFVQEGGVFRVARLTLTVSLDRQGTWVVRGKPSDTLLNHERLHWMMAIVVAYEMERAILALREPTLARLRQQVLSKFNWYRTRREPDLQRRYDRETNHGANATAQSRWRNDVNRWYTNRATRDIPLTTQ